MCREIIFRNVFPTAHDGLCSGSAWLTRRNSYICSRISTGRVRSEILELAFLLGDRMVDFKARREAVSLLPWADDGFVSVRLRSKSALVRSGLLKGTVIRKTLDWTDLAFRVSWKHKILRYSRHTKQWKVDEESCSNTRGRGYHVMERQGSQATKKR